jgi:hypothetical protein
MESGHLHCPNMASRWSSISGVLIQPRMRSQSPETRRMPTWPTTAGPRDTACEMSEKNVEIVREAIEAFNRGDLDAWIGFYDPEIEWHDVTSSGRALVVSFSWSANRDLLDPGSRRTPSTLVGAVRDRGFDLQPALPSSREEGAHL